MTQDHSTYWDYMAVLKRHEPVPPYSKIELLVSAQSQPRATRSRIVAIGVVITMLLCLDGLLMKIDHGGQGPIAVTKENRTAAVNPRHAFQTELVTHEINTVIDPISSPVISGHALPRIDPYQFIAVTSHENLARTLTRRYHERQKPESKITMVSAAVVVRPVLRRPGGVGADVLRADLLQVDSTTSDRAWRVEGAWCLAAPLSNYPAKGLSLAGAGVSLYYAISANFDLSIGFVTHGLATADNNRHVVFHDTTFVDNGTPVQNIIGEVQSATTNHNARLYTAAPGIRYFPFGRGDALNSLALYPYVSGAIGPMLFDGAGGLASMEEIGMILPLGSSIGLVAGIQAEQIYVHLNSALAAVTGRIGIGLNW